MLKIMKSNVEKQSVSGDDFLKAYIAVKEAEVKDCRFNEDDLRKIKSAVNIAISQFEREKILCNDNLLEKSIDGIIVEFNELLEKL